MKRKICEECGGTVVHKKVPYSLYGVELGEYPAEVCKSCGEVVFDEHVSDAIEAMTKRKGLYGLGVKTKVGKVGNSLDIRIGKEIVEFTQLKKGEVVTVIPESKKKIVILL